MTAADLCWIVGVNFRAAGGAANGIPFLERALALQQREFGLRHDKTLNTMRSLALCYREAGLVQKSTQQFEHALRLMTDYLGPDHLLTLGALNRLGLSYYDSGRLHKWCQPWETHFTDREPRSARIIPKHSIQ